METPFENAEKTPPVRFEFEGAFGANPVKVEAHACPGSKRLVLNLHGTFGNGFWGSGKYDSLAESLVSSKLANAILYSSSRDWGKARPYPESYVEKVAPFVGKTFEQELEDARRTLFLALSKSEEWFGVPRDEIEVVLHGNSLGGVLAFYLANEFPEVGAIVTVGTGLRTEPGDVPILDTFPPEGEVRSKLRAFGGDYLMERGTEDSVFSSDSFAAFFREVGAKRKSSVTYVGVDHSFSSVSGEESAEPFAAAVYNLADYLATGVLPSGEAIPSVPSEKSRYAWEAAELSEGVKGRLRAVGVLGAFAEVPEGYNPLIDD